MKYYKLIFDYENDEQYLLAEPCAVVKDKYAVYEGTVIDDWVPVTFECNPRNGSVVTEMLGNSYGWPIMSRRAIELLDGAIRNEVQLLPVKVINKDTKEEIENYYVLNVLPFLDALDLEHSLHTYFTCGDIKVLSVMKYALRKEGVENHNIFRLKESPMSIFVSEHFKRIAEENKMLGLDFLEVKVIS